MWLRFHLQWPFYEMIKPQKVGDSMAGGRHREGNTDPRNPSNAAYLYFVPTLIQGEVQLPLQPPRDLRRHGDRDGTPFRISARCRERCLCSFGTHAPRSPWAS